MKYSKDGIVCFDPETHTYKKGNTYLQGVTGLIERYKNPFDHERMATNYAAKHGLNKDEVLKNWNEEGQRSRDHGTAVHQFLEHYFLTGELVYPGISPKESVAKKFIDDYFVTGRLQIIEVEMIVYNDSLATQIDCVAKNPSGEYFILDWKTNKKISDNGYNKKMLPPFNRYPDASFFHYSLQMSLCRMLCKEYPIKDAYLVHLKEDTYDILSTELIHIPDNL